MTPLMEGEVGGPKVVKEDNTELAAVIKGVPDAVVANEFKG